MTENRIDIAALLDTRGTLRLGTSGGAEWRKVTEASIEEYRAHHQGGNYPPSTLAIMAMFEGFIAKWVRVWGAETLIDVGCGIGTELPPYIRTLSSHVKYAGLDPLDESPERDYAFICGRLEDLAARELDRKFDIAIFATSLDHFEDDRNALRMAATATQDGRIVIWSGLHDSPLVAGGYTLNGIIGICRNHRTILGRILAFLGYGLFVWPRVALRLAWRERQLRTGRRLDRLHFHYFTEERLKALLSEVGTIEDFVHCPGTNSAFIALTIKPTTD